MARIAFLGTGRMGWGMAARLVGAGHDVAVYNRTRDKTRPLAEIGARVAETPADAAHGAGAVFAMLGDDEASRKVWTGADGVFRAETAAGAFAVECSTLSHDWVLELAQAARAKGLRYIDCPVTGYPEQAAEGAITLLVGAEDRDLQDARPLLEPLAGEIIHFGPPGAGTAYKLTVNLMGAVQIAGAAEGLLMAEQAGLDMETVVHALACGAAASPQVVRNVRRMADADHDRDVVFSGRWRLKDTLYGLRLAEKLGRDAPFGRLAGDLLRRLVDAGLGDANESRIIDILRG